MTSQSSKSDGGNGIGGGNCGAGVVGSVGDMCENSGKGSGCSMGMGGDSIVLTESIGRTGELGGRTQEGGRGPDGFRR